MYEVEGILDKRVNPLTKKPEYQVKWSGFHKEESTWQPEQNLIFVKHLIDKFNKSKTKKEVGVTETVSQLKKRLNNPQLPKPTNCVYKFRDYADNYGEKSSDQDIVFDQFEEKVAKMSKTPQPQQDLRKKKMVMEKKYEEQTKENKNKLPPLPPDFNDNRDKYILPAEKIRQKKKEKDKEKLKQILSKKFGKKSNNKDIFAVEVKKQPQEPQVQPQIETEMKPEENYQILKILNMQKTESGYFYMTETTKGRLWLSRLEIFPKYSDMLCEFYETFITFS